ncbi:hypothetical protein WA538_002951 [Blastocystis sp. DL]
MFYSTSSQLNQDHIDSYCEEVLLARKAEHIGIDEEVDMESILKMPEGTTETRWYYCVIRDILRDCQFLASFLSDAGCRESCPHMNATTDIEYLCSCHSFNMKCCAMDYFYHNINYNTVKFSNLYSLIQSNSMSEKEIQKEMSSILRRLYRLYLHGYYQHFSTYSEKEVSMRGRVAS